MSDKKKNIPEIRFPGFTDDWEQRKLDDLCMIITKQTGFDYTNTIKKSLLTTKENNTLPYMQTKNFSGIDFDYNTDYYIPIDVANQFEKIVLDRKCLLLSIVGASVGNVAYFPNIVKCFLSGAICVAKPKIEDDTAFIYYYMSSEGGQEQIKTVTKGSGQATITIEDIREFNIPLPDKEEMIKISGFLYNLDNLITLHQRKCNEMKKLKKGMLQKMFPQKNEVVPQIRFPGFTDPWEQRKLNSIYEKIGNAFVGTATPYYVDEGHFYLESNNIKDGQINRNTEIFINEEFYQKQKDKWLHTGDIVMVQSGHVGHTAVIPQELDNSAAHALIMFRQPKEKINPYFLNYEFQTEVSKKKIDNITTGNTIKHILASEMQEFIVSIPEGEEQDKIGGYFQSLDHLIALHQRKCDELINMKKGFLQKMFV